MEESDLQAVGAFAGSFVDSADSLLLTLCESFGYAALYCECHMVHAALAAVLLDEFGDGAVGAGGFEELDLCVAYLEEGGCIITVW